MSFFRAWWYRLFRDDDRKSAPKAGAKSCGCPAGGVVVGCMVCGRTSCPEHHVHTHAGPDLDRLAPNVRQQTDVRFYLLVDASLADVDTAAADLLRFEVTEVER